MAKYNARIEVTKEIDVWFEVPLFTGDVGNDIRLSFYENGQAYDMNGAQVTALRADGEAVYDVAATEGNEAIITLKNNCYTQPGELSVFVTLTDAAGRAVTNGVLHFDVRRGYADGGDITADDRYPVLGELISEVEAASDRIENTYTKQEIEEKLDNVITVSYEGDTDKVDKMPDGKEHKLVIMQSTNPSWSYELPAGVYEAITLVDNSSSSVTQYGYHKYQEAVGTSGTRYRRCTHDGEIETVVTDPDDGPDIVITMPGQIWGDWEPVRPSNTVSVTVAPSGGTGDYICTGANDNLVIQQALNAATENGTKAATVVLMPGTYVINAGIVVPKGADLRGNGAVLTAASNAFTGAMLLVGDSCGITGISIRANEEYCNIQGISNAEGKGNHLKVRDCNFDTYSAGIMLSGTYNVWVEDNTMTSYANTLQCVNCTSVHLSGNTLWPNNYGVEITGGSDVYITGNKGGIIAQNVVSMYPSTPELLGALNGGAISIS